MNETNAAIHIPEQDTSRLGMHDRVVTMGGGIYDNQLRAIRSMLNKLSVKVQYTSYLSSLVRDTL